MNLVSLSEFCSLTALSQGDVLHMLEKGELKPVVDAANCLKIDISSLTAEQLANRSSKNTTLESSEILEEQIAAEVLNVLDEVLDEALAMAINWLNQEKTK